MGLSILQLKDSDLLILSNMLLVGLMLLVKFTMILYVGGNILLVSKTNRVKL